MSRLSADILSVDSENERVNFSAVKFLKGRHTPRLQTYFCNFWANALEPFCWPDILVLLASLFEFSLSVHFTSHNFELSSSSS